MKAIVRDRYGSPDVLELREIDRPVNGDDDVLVRVHAAGVASFSSSDWPGTIVPVAYTVWSLWLVATGIVLLT